MRKYIFEPDDLQRIVQMHLGVPLAERFETIAETLHDVYGEHIHLGVNGFGATPEGSCAP